MVDDNSDDEESFEAEFEDVLWADSAAVPATQENKDKPAAGQPASGHSKQGAKSEARIYTHTQDQSIKRKHDDTAEPAHVPKQTAKKQKTRHAEQPTTKPLPTRYTKSKAMIQDERRKSRIEEKMAEFSKAAKMPKPPGLDPVQTEEEENAAKAEKSKTHDQRMENIMSQLGMHPDNADTSSMVVHLPERGEDRVLTCIVNPHPETQKYILHDTPIPHNRNHAQAPRSTPTEPPFLKEGKHGRGGDFQNDPDRRTGRGHHIALEDQSAHDEYMNFRGVVFKKYPRWPGVDVGEEIDPNIKEAWDDNERWNNKFTYQYAGFGFAHLWPCGCEKVRGESEDEESEEELR